MDKEQQRLMVDATHRFLCGRMRNLSDVCEWASYNNLFKTFEHEVWFIHFSEQKDSCSVKYNQDYLFKYIKKLIT